MSREYSPADRHDSHAAASAHRFSAIEQELRLLGSLIDSDRPVQQFICSGDIANQWSDDQLYQLVSIVQESFFISQGATSSWCACAGQHILSTERLRLLRVLGFTGVRFSLQKQIVEGIKTCRECGGTVNVMPKAFAALAGQALACIEDSVVIENILTHLQGKDASVSRNLLPASRAPPADLFG